MNDFHGFEDKVDHIIKNIVDDVNIDDANGEELSAEDLIQLQKQSIEEEGEAPITEHKAFTRILTWKGSLRHHRFIPVLQRDLGREENFVCPVLPAAVF